MGEASAAQAVIPVLRAWNPARPSAPATWRTSAAAVSTLSDEALMARVQEGCETSFDALVTRHYHRVTNFAVRMVGRADLAADIAQHAFAAIHAQRSRYRRQASFRAWLYCIVRRECGRTLRRERRYVGSTVDGPPATSGGPDPHLAAERAESSARVRAALAGLPERERAAVTMFHYLGWPYDEIAQALGCSPGAARTAACRGRARLRRLLGQETE